MTINVIKRAEWGAIPNKYPFKKHVPNRITIHNIGSSESPIIDNFKGAESIRSIDNYHVNVRKWNAIGYHYIIAPNGDIYEGRPDDVVGAHVRNNNTGNIGINIYCNSNVEVPTDKQIEKCKELMLFLMNKYNIDSSTIKGHYQLCATDCPGTNIKKLLPEWVKEISQTPIIPIKTVKTPVKIVKNKEVLKLLKELSTNVKNMNDKLATIVELMKE